MAVKKKVTEAVETTVDINEYPVVNAFKDCTSVLVGGIEVKINNGNIRASKAFADSLKEKGII